MTSNTPVTSPTPLLVDPDGLNPQVESSDSTPISYTNHTRTGECRIKIWLQATSPLILHFLSILAITTSIRIYIADNDFNLTSRRAFAKFTPLQSDITTAISSSVTLLRIFVATWLGPMVWRCIFILMERGGGISLEQIDRLLTWQIYFDRRRKSKINLLISIVLFASFPCQLSGPILTGSITWSSSYQFSGAPEVAKIPSGYTGTQPDEFIKLAFPVDLSQADVYSQAKSLAAGVATTAWQGSQDDELTMKRVIRTPGIAEIPINSALNNVTLPYFSITKLEWIRDPSKELSDATLSANGVASQWNPFQSMQYVIGVPGTFAIIPETWGVVTLPSLPDANVTVVSETRTIMGIYSQSSVANDSTPCDPYNPFGQVLPANIGFIRKGFNCYIYGRITYVAGAAECKNCRVSSWRTIQNTTDLMVFPHFTTIYALQMMPSVTYLMVQQNASLPKALNNLESYVAGLLTRSYAVSWSVLTDWMSDADPLLTDIHIAVPTSRANVVWWRVWLWLSLNFMLTLFGLLFLFIQRSCSQPLVGNPSMAAFLMDTTEVLHRQNRAFCKFSSLVGEDKGMGNLHLPNAMDGVHKRVEVMEV